MASSRWNCGWGRLALLACFLTSLPATAQVVNDGATNPLDNVTNTGTGVVRVGNNNGLLGVNPASSNNESLVTGTGSFWSNRSDLVVGDSGSGNRLVISNGGLVGNNYGYLGFAATSSSNEAVVTGSGSFW